jgi:DNA-binding transcriptional ArsR family regulator
MDPDGDAEAQAQICGIFSNATRIHILWALADGELSVSDIAAEVDASLQSTSHHLRLMKDKGVLASRRSGRRVRYRINHLEPVDCLLNKAPEHMERRILDNPAKEIS